MTNKTDTENLRHMLRLLKLLSKRQKSGLSYKKEDQNFNLLLDKKSYRFKSVILLKIEKSGLIIKTCDKISITELGVMFLKKHLNPDSLLAPAQNKLVMADIRHNQEIQRVQINTNESPLLRLFSRKTKTGKSYISMEEFQAGERLRKDFEKGQLQPKVSANLESSMGASRRSCSNNAEDISDFALDARKRVCKAIDSLGPELSGVTIDICCFLKGLENVERERSWPPRSAKLMLKTALSLLACHYGISGYENERSGKKHMWGASDYRPSLIN